MRIDPGGRHQPIFAVLAVATMCIALAAGPAAALDSLPRLESYNVDPSQVSVSGFGNGGAMAIQLGVAYSSRIMGVAAFSGIPYDCRRRSDVTLNSCSGLLTPNIAPLEANMRLWSGRENDDVTNLARQRVFVFVGLHDSVNSGTVAGQIVNLYRAFVPDTNIRYVRTIDAGYMFPTDFDHPYSGFYPACSQLGSAMANCGYDGAGDALQWIYGPLNPRTAGLPDGDLIAVNQGEFVARSKGMDGIAWLYVPKSCASRVLCKLHIFLHDSGQSYSRAATRSSRITRATPDGRKRTASSSCFLRLIPTPPSIRAGPGTGKALTTSSSTRRAACRPRRSWRWSRASPAAIKDRPRRSSTTMPDSTITS